MARRTHRSTELTSLSAPAALALAFALAAFTVVLDLMTGPVINLAILKTLPLLACAPARRRSVVWGLAVLLLAVVWIVFLRETASDHDTALWQAILVNRSFASLTIIVVALTIHIWISADRRAQAARDELEQQNQALIEREEKIAHQNEELHSQAEELERQGEAVRLANDDLMQRQRTLRALLELSRSLTLDLPLDDALERICRTLSHLVDGPHTLTAILLKRDDHVLVRCHHGFGEAGVAADRLPAGRTFCELVMSQLRSGMVDDLALRPGAVVPQPAQGEPIASVLACPLLVRGRAIGTIEIYSRRKRTWDDHVIALIESLASQASTSLENAGLFEQVEQERSRLLAVLRTVPLGVALADAGGQKVQVNPAGAALLGVPAGTNIAALEDARHWRVLQVGTETSPGPHPLMSALRDGATTSDAQAELVLPGGRRLTLLVSAAPIRDAGQIVGAVATFADITALKSLQRELDRRRREAEEASVRKSRFLAAASHDIRTPANAISLLAELLRRTADSPAMAREVPELAEELRRSAMSLVELVNNVLDVSRFETGQIELHESDFDLGPLMEEEFRQVQPLARAKNLAYEIEPLPRPIMVRTDRVKLGRVLGNLLGNAIKFTDAGSVCLKACSPQGNDAAAGVHISVSDTGVGIAPEHQQSIFDEFYTLADPHHSRGSGLGLAICKRLTDAMGGAIQVSSQPGRGSTFTVALPATMVVTEATAAAPSDTAPAAAEPREALTRKP